MEEYTPTADEMKLHARFTVESTMHTWAMKDKLTYLSYLNKRAGLPFGTIGMIQQKAKNSDEVVKEIPYASRQTSVELGRKHKISLKQSKENINSERAVYTYTARDLDTGREVDAVGACTLQGGKYPMTPEMQANKIMHAETKAKRRATLEICGLAFLDDSEVDDVEGATRVDLGDESPKPASTNGQSATEVAAKPASASASPAAKDSKPSEAPKQAVGTPPAVPAPTAVEPPVPALPSNCPRRFAEHAELFVGDETAIVADAEHMKFIVYGCKELCGWTGPQMNQFLKESFDVTNENRTKTLTLDVFSRIMQSVDLALTNAGR